jgi:hypothetical protein
MSLSVHLYSLRVPMGMTIEGRTSPSASHLFNVSAATPIFSAACSVEWASRTGTVGYRNKTGSQSDLELDRRRLIVGPETQILWRVPETQLPESLVRTFPKALA